MHLVYKLDEWIQIRKTLSSYDQIGFVPTMGNLHAGHASLFSKSVAENQCTISSLFINPTQFNQREDFTHYPRTLESDLALMEELGVDYCILPEEEEIYADGYNYQVQEQQSCELMEGKYRPGHFNGVLTVVLKLLHLTRPTSAYFGEKDYQQYLLIKGMVKALWMDINIIACPTVREKNGLALSSRNNRLTAEQKKLAEEFARIFHQNASCELITQELKEANISVDYIQEYLNRRFAAVHIGDIRLIDNYALDLFAHDTI